MRDKSDRFGGTVELSPRRDEPLLHPNSSTSLDALATSSVSLTLCVASATALRPMQKGITSNPMCEISLVLDDGTGNSSGGNGLRSHHPQQHTGDAKTDRKIMENRSSDSSSTAHSISGGIVAKTFKTKVVRSSLNPIWNMDVDFGDYNADSVLGVLVVVRHIEKLGLVKRDIGQVLLPMRELLDLKTRPTQEHTYTLEATDDTNAREAQEGISNRKYGKVTIRFNSYGLSKSAPALQNYTGLMTAADKTDVRSSAMSDGSVAHEDDFSSSVIKRTSANSHDVQSEVKKLQSFHQTKPVPGEIWYAVNSQWITNWLLFVSKHRGKQQFNPGEIDNMALISDDLPNGRFEVRPNLTIKKDFRMINQRSWELYLAQYGGGPAIEVPVPQDCADTAAWLASLRLEQVARVASGYY